MTLCILCAFSKPTLLSALGVQTLPTDDATIYMLNLVREVEAIQTICPAHPGHPVSFACLECYQSLCSYCLASAVMEEKHPGHSVIDLNKALDQIRLESQSQVVTIEEKKLVVNQIKGLSKQDFQKKVEEVMEECQTQAKSAIARIQEWEENTLTHLASTVKRYKEPTSDDEDDEVRNLLDNADYVQHELLSVSVKARKKDVSVLRNYKSRQKDAADVLDHIDEYRANNKPKGPEVWLEGEVEVVMGKVMITSSDAHSPRRYKTVVENKAEDGKVYLIADHDSESDVEYMTGDIVEEDDI